MELLRELEAEHGLIDRVLGSLRTWAQERGGRAGWTEDGRRFLNFFRRYAGHYHHAREEDVLFASLVRDAELPAERGPIAVITREHARMAAQLDALEAWLEGAQDEGSLASLEEAARTYSHALWHHLDAENSVLFPESEVRLRQHHVRELPSRPPTDEEREARDLGVALSLKYAPLEDPTLHRGEGCVMCPAYAQDCRGLEREWWNEWEWEEADDRLAGL